MFSGIVLAGGTSKRMERDKRLLVFNNQTLLERSVKRLQKITTKVVVVLAKEDKFDMNDVVFTHDSESGKGPLMGIYSGLLKIKTENAVVMPVDTPFIRISFLKYLMKNASDYDIVVPRWSRGIEPLAAIYSKNMIQIIREYIESGKKTAPHLLINELNRKKVRFIEEDEIRKFGNPEILFYNINTQDDLDNANKILELINERH
ncbi:MAG: molybdenum cofactor guanylyltransferase [Thermodesulfobacteriota bacterium]